MSKDITQSIFEKNYKELPESKKELLNQKYSCSICYEIIKYENPFLCYECQKIFHHSCLKSWDTRQKQLGKELTCPNCRNELPFENWKVQRNHEENRTKDVAILNQIGKSFNLDEYADKSLTLFKIIVNKLNSMHSFLKFDKSYKLDNLIEEFKSNLINPSLDDISAVIVEELELLDEYIKQTKKRKDEQVIYKNEIKEINLKYTVEKDGRYKIFGDYFTEYNTNFLSLIINGKKYPLVNEYNLKKGENIVTMCIKNNLKNCSYMFYDCKALANIKELEYLNIENVTDFSHMFEKTEISDITPLRNWNTSKAKSLLSMFNSCKLLTNIKILENWNVSNCNEFSFMFYGCENLSNIKALENWNVSNGKNFERMFSGCNIYDIKPLEKWDVSKGYNFKYMFSDCHCITDFKPLEKWNVMNATYLNGLFAEFNISNLNFLQNWNVSKCKDFSFMFESCEKLKDLKPIQNWDVSKGQYFYNMFDGCHLLSDLQPIENWDISNGEIFNQMFKDCKSIKNKNVLKKWKFRNNDSFQSMFK